MRKLLTLLLTLAVCLAATAGGVSLSLARQRAATVSGVGYDLQFSIPGSLSQPVTGKAVVTFSYSGDGDLPLDFTGRLLKDGGAWCRINGKACRGAIVADEHVTLPGTMLRRGRNTVEMAFESSDASLNRHSDYMYTLFVPANARSCFPCFDQPDLKARFTLRLSCPEGWTTLCSEQGDGAKPIPTYLFSFVAGKFQRRTAVRGGHAMTVLYRETDSAKVAQIDKVLDEAAYSIDWMERYTGIRQPFGSYGLVVLPGYQFGGMEHPGAIQLNDREIFLGPNPTPDEELTRLELIAHETAHLWFGDLVTMRWFDDVWTKEVFANFLAAKVSRELYPGVNHSLNFLKAYQRPALSVDRTGGTHPIQQPLGNLKDAGLLYGNIIYDKAPVMMRKLEEQANSPVADGGGDAFRDGLRAYLRKYGYGNATWDDLISILDSVAPQARLRDFSEVWVKQRGLPTISAIIASDGTGQGRVLRVRQHDPWGRGLVWPQRFGVAVDYGDSLGCKEVVMDRAEVDVPLASGKRPEGGVHIFPNIDGRGYGRFIINDGDMEASAGLVTSGQREDETGAYATLLNLHENFLMGRLSGRRYFKALCDALDACANPLIGSTIVGNMATVRYYAPDSLRHAYERVSLAYARNHRLRPVRQLLLRALSTSATDKAVTDTLYNVWLHRRDTTLLPAGTLTTRDFTRMAWHLAVVMPGRADSILAGQRAMLRTDDERREFDYVSRACTADTAMQRRLFYGLIPKSGRTVEPWAREMLGLLCGRTREPQCNSYIKPGLDSLLMIQQSSDIFFPGYWLSALLAGQHSAEAADMVRRWIDGHPDYPAQLMNKLRQAAYGLLEGPGGLVDGRPSP